MNVIQRVRLIILCSAYFIFGTGSLAVVGLTTAMADSFHVSQSQIAQFITVFAFAFALVAPFVQMIGRRCTRKTLIVIGLCLLSLGLIGIGLSPNYTIAIGFRILSAVGAAMVGPIASSLGASFAPADQKAKALAIVFSGMSIATVIGVPLSAWLGQQMAWETVFVLLGVCAFVIGLLVQWVIKDNPHHATVRCVDFIGLFKQRSTRFAMGAILMQMAAQFTTYALISVFLVEGFQASASKVSLALMLFGVGGVLANVIVGKIGDRFSEEYLLLTSLFLLGLVFFVLDRVPKNHIEIAITLITAWALVATLFMVPQQKRLLKLAPEQSGLLLSINASAMYLGMSLGAAIAATVSSSFSSQTLPLASFLLVAVSALCQLSSMQAFRMERASADAMPAKQDARRQSSSSSMHDKATCKTKPE